jgi:hypothetical protein
VGGSNGRLPEPEHAQAAHYPSGDEAAWHARRSRALAEKTRGTFTHSVVLAEAETTTFRFQGVGRSQEEALAALLSGWDAHVREHTRDDLGPDPDLMRSLVARGDVALTTLRTGQAYRDGELLA